jgi:hypothetical protein
LFRVERRPSPRQIHRRYRTHFGIEASYRQIRQARIYTCTRDPRLRLVFVAVGLVGGTYGCGFTPSYCPELLARPRAV